MAERQYMVSLHVTVKEKAEALAIVDSLGTVFLGHVHENRDVSLHVAVYNEDDEIEMEAEVNTDDGAVMD